MADPTSRIIVAIDRMTQADALGDMGRLGSRLAFLKLGLLVTVPALFTALAIAAH